MSTSHLLLDSRVVASTSDAKLELGRVQKHPANPLFAEEAFADPPKPWEARLDNVYPNVIYDDEDSLFKCWYKSFIYDGLSNRTSLPQRPQQAYGESEREEGLLYATSHDGIRWEKPALGIIDFEGSRANNIVMRRATHGLHAGGVLQDDCEPDPARRYKFIHRNASAGRMATCFSADGLNWSQPLLWAEHDAVGDCHNNAVFFARAPALHLRHPRLGGWRPHRHAQRKRRFRQLVAAGRDHARGECSRSDLFHADLSLWRALYRLAIGLPQRRCECRQLGYGRYRSGG